VAHLIEGGSLSKVSGRSLQHPRGGENETQNEEGSALGEDVRAKKHPHFGPYHDRMPQGD